MTVSHLTSKDYRTSRWSGGETTELLIWPRDAVYGQRDFLFRVSSATVELNESTFTALPDYHRLIATLEGTITLCHDGMDDENSLDNPEKITPKTGSLKCEAGKKNTVLNDELQPMSFRIYKIKK